MLKEARYKCWGHGPEFPEFNVVKYLIISDHCYFTGIERKKRTSTINAAREIVQAIADQEGVPLRSLRFFDLQTHQGYNKRLGEYALDEVVIPDEFQSGVRWYPADCTSEVQTAFQGYIW